MRFRDMRLCSISMQAGAAHRRTLAAEYVLKAFMNDPAINNILIEKLLDTC